MRGFPESDLNIIARLMKKHVPFPFYPLIYSLVLVLLLTFSSETSGQTSSIEERRNSSGLFDRIAALEDGIRYWIDNPLHTEYSNTDCFVPISLDKVLAGFEIRNLSFSGDALDVVASRPPFLGLFSTQLSYHIQSVNNRNIQVSWIPTWTPTDVGVQFDDSLHANFIGTLRTPVEYWCANRMGVLSSKSGSMTGEERFWDQLRDVLSSRFYLYRSLGMPNCFKPDLHSIKVGAVLNVHGRDLHSFRFDSFDQLLEIIDRMSRDHPTYAGPISISLDPSKFTTSFYFLIVNEELQQHHFFTIEESFQYYASTQFLAELFVTVNLHPYIRTDNIKSVYRKTPHKP